MIKLLSPSFYEDVPSNEQNYLFWKYENYIRVREYSLASQMAYRQYGRLSTEHIIPQTPRNTLSWMAEGATRGLYSKWCKGLTELW